MLLVTFLFVQRKMECESYIYLFVATVFFKLLIFDNSVQNYAMIQLYWGLNTL